MTHRGDGGRTENKEGRGVDEWTTVQILRRKMRRSKSDERMMGRGERMKDYLVTGAIFYSSGDKAQTCPVVNQRPFLTRRPPLI